MSALIASLPMYDWPEARAATDATWVRLRDRLRKQGIDAPESLVRRNGDMPGVSGGIRDAAGHVLAPDPAMLPPDELDLATLWRHPQLLLAATCWGPMEMGLARHVHVVGQTRYDGIEGGAGEDYSSVIVMRRWEGRVAAPHDGSPLLPVDLLRGKRLAFNSPDSMSGVVALRRNLVDLKAIAEEGEFAAFWGTMVETGGHRASIRTVAEGTADVAAIDCRTWRLARRFEPAARNVVAVGWTGRRPGLPFVSAAGTAAAVLQALKLVLAGPG